MNGNGIFLWLIDGLISKTFTKHSHHSAALSLSLKIHEKGQFFKRHQVSRQRRWLSSIVWQLWQFLDRSNLGWTNKNVCSNFEERSNLDILQIVEAKSQSTTDLGTPCSLKIVREMRKVKVKVCGHWLLYIIIILPVSSNKCAQLGYLGIGTSITYNNMWSLIQYKQGDRYMCERGYLGIPA